MLMQTLDVPVMKGRKSYSLKEDFHYQDVVLLFALAHKMNELTLCNTTHTVYY